MTREAYYHHRAPEYDDFWLRRRRYGDSPPAWAAERDEALRLISQLEPRRTLDIACGTGFVTRVLPGEVTALDQSQRMLDVAGRQAPAASLVRGNGLHLPFADGSFERVFTSHFYGHLDVDERASFLSEARRVAPELVILDAALHDGPERDEWQERTLNDGTTWTVYKRFFSAASLSAELGGRCTTLFDGRWFVILRSTTGRGRPRSPRAG